jgi:L-threonylcarbamoyladenylate synthase
LAGGFGILQAMSEIILYPTETIYGLGVNAFDEEAWAKLCVLKGRSESQTASWLVRSIADIERLAEVTEEARQLMEKYLPGPLTVVLKARDNVPLQCRAADGTVSFRISSDPIAQRIITKYMEGSGGVPLTCTSANVHGQPTMSTPEEILEQFGERQHLITEVIDDGVRNGLASTVVRCAEGVIEVLRSGTITIN